MLIGRAAFLAGLILAGMPARAAPSLSCPAMLPAQHDEFEQMGPSPTKPAALDGMRLFDGPPGEETAAAPVELAPDGSKTTPSGFINEYVFAGNEKLLLVCTYRGTATYYRVRLHPLPLRCVLRRSGHETTARCE